MGAIQAYRRRSLRLRGYDDAQAGAYFVTVVTQQRALLSGEVVEGVVRLSALRRVRRSIVEDPLPWAPAPQHPAALRLQGRALRA